MNAIEPLSSVWVAFPAGLGLLAAWQIGSSAMERRRARHQLFRGEEQLPAIADSRSQEPDRWGSWLERWLSISGFRGEGAVPKFLLLQGLSVLVAAAIGLSVAKSGMMEVGIEWLLEIPGGIGELLAPILSAAPWISASVFGLSPITWVRSRRRGIVQSIERDLPIALALLATLVESGLGFDAALDRVLGSMDPDRPLARELQLFRSETRAGVPRLACFRALAQRTDIASMSTFVSAMIHSEDVGGGVAQSMRRQADEVWSRRRELAIQRAQTLPTKLSVPLVLCFLPGIFVYTFGPALAEFLRIADGVISGDR